MTPYYSDDWLTLYGGDCREVLASLPADSVDCVVTSPPYWGLRDYGTATWEGGDPECDHEPDKRGSRFATPVSEKQRSNTGSGSISQRDCKCGATRIDSQLGLERTPEEYVANMVAVFSEVRRVLKPSGTCWLNLGDSYAGYWGDKTAKAEGRRSSADTNGWTNGFHMNAKPGFHEAFDASGIKPKDLVGIPWRVAFALQADGWYLRSDIIWAKPNPMPESVTDRPTKAHEYLFLLTKSSRYFFDSDAVREAHTTPPQMFNGKPRTGRVDYEGKDYSEHRGRGDASFMGLPEGGRNIRSVWTIATRPYPGAHFAVFPPELPERCIKAGSSEKGVCPECGAPWERVVERGRGVTKSERVRNVGGRTDGYTQLPAGGISGISTTTIGWQANCQCRGGLHGDPSERTDRAHRAAHPPGSEGHRGFAPNASVRAGVAAHADSVHPSGHSGSDRGKVPDRSLGWRSGCYHNPVRDELAAEGLAFDFAGDPLPECEPVPAVILDPFGGSGTVGMVANRLSRRAILIDLNPDYLKQQLARNAQTPLGLDAA